MCSIFGAMVWDQQSEESNSETNRIIKHIYRRAHDRGRDGRGFNLRGAEYTVNVREVSKFQGEKLDNPIVLPQTGVATWIGNTRAEPTTEFVLEKKRSDQQPYSLHNWTVVHNGTIANDKELRSACILSQKVDTKIDSAAIVETLAEITASRSDEFGQQVFIDCIRQLKGSFAIIATAVFNSEIFVACNYRPIWYISTDFGVFFASTRNSFPGGYIPQMIEPYSIATFTAPIVRKGWYARMESFSLREHGHAVPKALVVCSGGLDSVVSAVYAQKILGYNVELIHFNYGSRAGSPELTAIKNVAEFMGVPLHIKTLPMWDKEDSPLLQHDSKIAGGEEGAEFAHEWVPARNLVMLAVATAYAEAKGFQFIVLGNNLEEAGAYPDNEPEFIDRFNDLLPFAVGDGKKVHVIMPVGNMMKHEIVKLGNEIGAPMHLTWSCYKAGKLHCGKCGPCFMRRTAFQINNLKEVVDYEV